MVILNHNSFRVLPYMIASVYFIWKHIYILARKMASSPGKQHCASCIGTLSFLIAVFRLWAVGGAACVSLSEWRDGAARVCVQRFQRLRRATAWRHHIPQAGRQQEEQGLSIEGINENLIRCIRSAFYKVYGGYIFQLWWTCYISLM